MLGLYLASALATLNIARTFAGIFIVLCSSQYPSGLSTTGRTMSSSMIVVSPERAGEDAAMMCSGSGVLAPSVIL